MQVLTSTKAKIENLVSNYDLGNSEDPAKEAIEAALSIGSLPIHLDIGGVFAIKPAGEIILILWDEPNQIEVVTDPRMINIVLFQGSNKYPDLAVLIPDKPMDAQVCPYCEGTGLALPPVGVKNLQVVCYCGGIGWLP